MIGCYATGIFPHPEELIQVARAYNRREADEKKLERAFERATTRTVKAQISAGFSYITDGMLKWQNLLRPFTENLGGVETGGLTRWFNNNTFYRKPVITNKLYRKKNIIQNMAHTKHLSENIPWKAILPAPYTFAQLSDNRFYRNKTELMFEYAQVLRQEIESLAKSGFRYVQLSDPALVYEPAAKDELRFVEEALKTAVGQSPIRTCLQTFFGDFSKILPDVLDFSVDDVGMDLYEVNLKELKRYSLNKGIALGLVDSRNSLVENEDKLVRIATRVITWMYRDGPRDFFVCPNCDLEFLPWKRALEKMKVVGSVTARLRREFDD